MTETPHRGEGTATAARASALTRSVDLLRGVVDGAMYPLKSKAAQFPSLALPLARLRGEGELLDAHTDILIESFPRSGSSFAVAAFRLAQEPRIVSVANQTHAPGHVIAAVRQGVPALVLIREPRDVVVSNLFRHPDRGVNGLLRGYLRFYRPLAPHRSGFVVGTFEEVAGGRLGSVIRRVNERFGTEFAEFEATEANVERCFRAIDAEWRRRRGEMTERLERFVPRPSQLREKGKEALLRRFDTEASRTLRDRAQGLYDGLAG